jgi:hypothetical protein
MATTVKAYSRSSQTSIARWAAGLSILNTAILQPSLPWTAGSGCACAVSCDAVRGFAVGEEGEIINAGLTLSLANMGCSLLWQHMNMLVNPVAGEPPTGEPDAGDPPVRFGGRGGRMALPPPIGKKIPNHSIFGTVCTAIAT